MHHLRGDCWRCLGECLLRRVAVRVVPAPAVKTITQTGGPPWAVDIFNGLRAANGGKLGGFFDVFAWREPGEVRFAEVKVGRDPIGPNQRRFVKLALDLHHFLDEFTIIEVPGRALPARAKRSPQRPHL